MNYDDIYKKIRTKRIEQKLSQKYVADRCGLSQQAINRIEYGKQSISLELFLKLSEILNFSIPEVLELPDDLENQSSETDSEKDSIYEIALELSHKPELFLLFQTAKDLPDSRLHAYLEFMKTLENKNEPK